MIFTLSLYQFWKKKIDKPEFPFKKVISYWLIGFKLRKHEKCRESVFLCSGEISIYISPPFEKVFWNVLQEDIKSRELIIPWCLSGGCRSTAKKLWGELSQKSDKNQWGAPELWEIKGKTERQIGNSIKY